MVRGHTLSIAPSDQLPILSALVNFAHGNPAFQLPHSWPRKIPTGDAAINTEERASPIVMIQLPIFQSTSIRWMFTYNPQSQSLQNGWLKIEICRFSVGVGLDRPQ